MSVFRISPLILGPNITGECIPGNPSRWLSIGSSQGAFTATKSSGGDGAANNGNSNPAGLRLDSSTANSLYGKSVTIQPDSAYSFMIIKE